jgi:hypothetical protein
LISSCDAQSESFQDHQVSIWIVHTDAISVDLQDFTKLGFHEHHLSVIMDMVTYAFGALFFFGCCCDHCCRFVYMMTQHPEVAEKIEQELICTFEKSETEDQSESAAPMIMNRKKSGLDDDDSKASDEASFNLRVAEYSQHLTYDSLLNLQYLYAAILETLRLYPAVPMVRTHTQKLNPSQMICPPFLPCNLSLQKTSMCFFINV